MNPLGARQIISVAISDVKYSDDALLKTTLGSCVSVVLFPDPQKTNKTFSSMSHYLLPEPSSASDPDRHPFRFGSILIPHQIKQMLAGGVPRGLLRAKVAGGARMLTGKMNSVIPDIGESNIDLAEKLLRSERIPIVGRNLGGTIGRSITFDPESRSLRVLVFGNEPVFI